MMRGVGGVRKSINHSWLAKGLGLGSPCWGFKGFQQEIPSEEALFKSGQWHFHQDNAPVHNSILVTDYMTKMGLKTVPQPLFSPDLAPCDFGCSLSSEAVVMRQLRRWKRLWHWHAHTRRVSWGIPEVVRTVQQVHCSRRRLHRRGLDFHMCTLNKSAHSKKSLETYHMPLVFQKYLKPFNCVKKNEPRFI